MIIVSHVQKWASSEKSKPVETEHILTVRSVWLVMHTCTSYAICI